MIRHNLKIRISIIESPTMKSPEITKSEFFGGEGILDGDVCSCSQEELGLERVERVDGAIFRINSNIYDCYNFYLFRSLRYSCVRPSTSSGS